MRRQRTLRGRVSMLALGVIAGWVVVLAIGFDIVLDHRLSVQVDDTVRVRAEAASATVDLRHDQPTGLTDSPTDVVLDSRIWLYRGADLVTHPPHVTAAANRTALSLARTAFRYADAPGWRFYSLPVVVDHEQVGTIVAGVDAAPYEKTERTAILGTVAVVLLVIAGAYPVLRFAASRALLPVARMTGQAAEWSVSDPARRFGGSQQYAELAALAASMDLLLDRMSAIIRHEHQLSGELSHELRTPLARVVTSIDLMLDEASPERQEELTALRDTCMGMAATIDTLLTTAQTELRGPVGRCSLAEVLSTFAAAGPPEVCVAPTSLSVGVEEAVLRRMLAPVIDNARRFAAHTIWLAAQREDANIVVTIANDGPRLSQAEADQVFQPGFRGQTQHGHDGAGLGLALARRLAQAADGQLDLEINGESAGSRDITTFRLTLPAG